MKTITFSLLMALTGGCLAQTISHKEAAGTWQLYDIKITLASPDEVVDVASTELMEKLNLTANVGEYHADSTFSDVYYGEGGKELGKSTGRWYIKRDSFYVIQEGGQSIAYHLEMKGDTGTFSGFVDWDADGAQDDLVESRAIRIAGDMKTYYFVSLFSASPEHSYSPEERREIQAAHLANIRKLAEEKKLVLAGPFLDSEDLRGIFILNVDSQEEAEAFTATDPAVKAGVLRMEVRPWWGPYELMGLLD